MSTATETTPETNTPAESATRIVSGEWTDPAYIPPRCRKPRSKTYQASTEVTIETVTPGDAPMAFTVTENCPPMTVPVRSHDDSLYRPLMLRARHTLNGTDDRHLTPHDSEWDGWSHRSYEENTNEAAWASDAHKHYDGLYLIIEGHVWVRCHEPRFYMTTFGFGGGHGGTGLFTEWYDRGAGAADCYFRADQFREAQTAAIALATGRDDTDSAASIQARECPVVVHDPGQVRLLIPRQSEDQDRARSALSDLADVYAHTLSGRADYRAADSEHDAWEALVAARADLVSKSPVGFIGTGEEIAARPIECRSY